MKEADARERMIAKGLEVLSEQGFAATGLDALLKSAGVPKGSFYHYFRSKSNFGLAVLERYAEIWDRKLCRILRAKRIGDVFDSWAAHMEACLKEAVESGEISGTLNAKLLSQFFWTSWEGAVLRSKVQRSIAPLLQFREVILCHLSTAHVFGSTAPCIPSDQ